ncbi:hypothetical protein M0R45_004597 [Rubus argutus]|uniref:Cytochrome b561 and DOMON domain-containing protein n=1 Tax=Rubus argutus TaxID=59490 RepID=A0AAW1YKA5_RUBAR
MAKVHSLFFLSLLLTFSFSTLAEQPCSTQQFPNHKTFAACSDLHVLNASIYWNYFPSNGTVDIAFRESLVSESRWVAWAINPSSKGMVGSQAFIAFSRTDGSMAVYSSPIKSYATHLEQGNLTFPVYNLSAIYKNREITIFVTLGLSNNVTTGHRGSNRFTSFFGVHHENSPWNYKHYRLGYTYAFGAIVARNLKGLGPAWFYIHVSCQILGYFGGIAGFVTGLLLGTKSSGIQYQGHRCIGITLIILATVQVLVGFCLRPKPDHKYRLYWNLFHYFFGYTTIVLGIVNIFKGFDILEPPKSWRYAYIGILTALVFLGAVWAIFTHWKNKKTSEASYKCRQEQTADEIV